MFNLTKIICTIGPSTCNKEMMKKLMSTGMDVARLNFSHGSHEAHLENIKSLRDAAAELNLQIAILADLQGPKIRVGKLMNGPMKLECDSIVTITTDENRSGAGIIPTVYKNLANDVKAGSKILLDDGLLEFVVLEVKAGTDVTCRVVKGGVLKEKKGINLPNVNVSAPAVTEKDYADLEFALANGVDYVALSFVRHASDIDNVKRAIHKKGLDTPVIAKIERPEAVVNFESILKSADGIMVARGDLGVEMLPEKVPAIQKRIIKKCNMEGKPVIVATQMLESMIENPRPTRAESSDVANAIMDGADAIMLSGETASGKYPVEAVEMMARISKEIEELLFLQHQSHETLRVLNPIYGAADSLCHATGVTARELKAKLIVTYTESGSTALLVSKNRPRIPILAITMSPKTSRRINLYWGVIPTLIEGVSGTDRMIEKAEEAALTSKLAAPGDYIVITGGVPVGQPGSTNIMKIHKISNCCIAGRKHESNMIKSEYCENGITIALDSDKCISCGVCVHCCSYKIFGFQNERVFINAENVKNCSAEKICVRSCPVGAIKLTKI